MAKANSRNWKALYLKEVTPGTTPASAGTIIRTTGGGGRASFASEESDELQLNETPDVIRVGADGTFTLNGEWSYGAIHWLLEAIHQSTFSTNVLQIGSTLTTFTIEEQFGNITKFLPWKGCVVERFTLTLNRGKILWSATLRPMTIPTAYAGTTAFTGAATAAPTNVIGSHVKSLQLAQEGGSLDLKAAAVGLTQFSLEWSRATIPYPMLGSLSMADIDQAQISVKGQFTAYLPDSALLDKLFGDTMTSLALTIGGASSLKEAYAFTNVRLIDGGHTAAVKGQAILQELSFQSVYDATNTGSKITRTP